MIYLSLGVWVSIALLRTALPLEAHHAPSAIFDMDHKLTLTGLCTGVDWVNPHIILHLDAKDAAGKVANWTFESNPPAWFKKAGVSGRMSSKPPARTCHRRRVARQGWLELWLFPEDHVRRRDRAWSGIAYWIKLSLRKSEELLGGSHADVACLLYRSGACSGCSRSS